MKAIKKMELEKHFAAKTFIDFLGMRQQEIIIDEHGIGELLCNTCSVLLWTLKELILPYLTNSFTRPSSL